MSSLAFPTGIVTFPQETKNTSCHTSMFAGERQDILGFDVPMEGPAKNSATKNRMVNPQTVGQKSHSLPASRFLSLGVILCKWDRPQAASKAVLTLALALNGSMECRLRAIRLAASPPERNLSAKR